MDTKKSSYAKEDNENEDEWARLIERKKEELKQLREKEERLCQKELHYQREKEALLTQYKQVFPDKPDWSRKNSTSVDPNNSADNRHQDVFKVGCQIHQRKKQQEKLELQLREKQARKMLAEVDDALKMEKKGFGLETPLLKWYLKIINYIKMDDEKDNENIPESEKSLCMADRMFYQVKYQTKDGNHPQWNIPLGKQQYQSLPGKWLEELSFSTRRKGTCVHVTITRKDSKHSFSSKSPLDASNCFEESEPFVFSTDPYVTDCHERGLELLLQNDQPEKFIKDVVWNYIDTETS